MSLIAVLLFEEDTKDVLYLFVFVLNEKMIIEFNSYPNLGLISTSGYAVRFSCPWNLKMQLECELESK